jgi:hypothetical protein
MSEEGSDWNQRDRHRVSVEKYRELTSLVSMGKLSLRFMSPSKVNHPVDDKLNNFHFNS